MLISNGIFNKFHSEALFIDDFSTFQNFFEFNSSFYGNSFFEVSAPAFEDSMIAGWRGALDRFEAASAALWPGASPESASEELLVVERSCGCPICSSDSNMPHFTGSEDDPVDAPLSAPTARNLTTFTNDQIADYIRDGGWVASGSVPRKWDLSGGKTLTVDVSGLTADGATLARAALQVWTDVTGITFTEQTGGANITFDDEDDGAYAGTSFFPSLNKIDSVNVNVSKQWLIDYGTGLYSYSMQTYIHEVGHALGLSHPGNYDGSANYPGSAAFNNDSWQASVMSYFSQTQNTAVNASYSFVGTPMIADVIAVHAMYGAPTSGVRDGNTVYGFNSTAGNAVFDATQFTDQPSFVIFDTGGYDTLDYSGFNQNQTLDLRPEQYSSMGGETGNFTIARGAQIEAAIGGGGDDRLIGNDLWNTLIGNAGSDTLEGGGGNDILNGGAGTDFLLGGAGNDTLNGGADADIAFTDAGADHIDGGAGIDYMSYAILTQAVGINLATGIAIGGAAGDTYANLEAFFLSQSADSFVGDANNNFVFGQGGDDLIFGGGGGDILFGEGGNDYFQSGALSDIIVGGAGADDFFYASNQVEQDQILDFVSGEDEFLFLGSGFNMSGQAITLGQNLIITTSAAGASYTGNTGVLIYYTDLGQLYADLDGAGAVGANLIAALGAGTVLQAGDVRIVAAGRTAEDALPTGAEMEQVANVAEADLGGTGDGSAFIYAPPMALAALQPEPEPAFSAYAPAGPAALHLDISDFEAYSDFDPHQRRDDVWSHDTWLAA